MSDREIIYIPLSDLRTFPGNPKDLLAAEREKLKDSIIKHGILKSINVWQKSKLAYILDGNERLEILEELNEEGKLASIPGILQGDSIPCEPVACEDMTDAAAKCLVLIGQYGRINTTKLKKFVKKAGYKDIDDAQTAMSFPELDAGVMNGGGNLDGNDDKEKVDLAEMAKARIFQCPNCQTWGYYKNHKAKGVDKKDIWDEQQA